LNGWTENSNHVHVSDLGFEIISSLSMTAKGLGYSDAHPNPVSPTVLEKLNQGNSLGLDVVGASVWSGFDQCGKKDVLSKTAAGLISLYLVKHFTLQRNM